MKKVISIVILICLLLGVTGCKIKNDNPRSTSEPTGKEEKEIYTKVSVPTVISVDEYPEISFSESEIIEGVKFDSLLDGKDITLSCLRVSISGALRTGNELVFYINGNKVGGIGRNQGSYLDISEGAKKFIVKGENVLTCEIPSGAKVKGSLIYYADVLAEKCSLNINNISEKIIDEDLFGANFEITRSTWFGGLSAELINNRKFYALSDDGNPSGFKLSGGKVITDKSKSICGSNYILLGDGEKLISNNQNIYLTKGEIYTFEITVNSESKNSKIEICVNDEKVGTLVSEKTQGKYDTLSCEFEAARSIENGEISISVSGNEISIFTVSLMNKNNIMGMRPDVIESLKEIAPVSLRYPGGCCVDRFDYDNSLLSKNERVPMYADEAGYTRMGSFLFTSTYNQDTVDFGLNEFLKLCELIGAKVELSVSLVRGGAEKASSIVKYCKDKNIEVSLWYVGNEVYFFGNELYKNPLLAAKKTNEYIKAMRAVNNDVKIAIGFCNNTEEMKNWSKVYLTNVSENYDVISLHYYYGGDLSELNTFSAEQKLREMKGVTENYNEAVKGLLSFLDDNGLSALKNKEICVDEWNWQFGEKGTTSMFVGNSCFLISLINSISISNLSSSSFFHPLEGQIEVNNETQEITGVGYAIRLLENHKNTKLVNVDVSEDLKALVSVNDNEVIISISNPFLTSKYVVLNNLITLGNFTEGNVKIISANSISNTDICTVSAGNMVMETYETSDFDGFLVPGISLVQIILR